MRNLIVVLAAAQLAWPQQMQRQQDLKVLLDILTPSRPPATGRINPFDKTWEDWVRRTGELPPDFASLPAQAELPDPLLRDGARITTVEQWNRHKPHLREQVERWIFGKMPPKPTSLRAVVTGERKEGSVTVRDVRLEFGPAHLRVHLVIPEGKGPFPVFLTNHNRSRSWLYTAVNRGYIACYYSATDPNYGDNDDSDAFFEAYPDYDFSVLGKWAWSASRAVDYLVTLPEVAKDQIGLAGHSRNGKQALLAAAFDERIAAVVPSSGMTGETMPWRFNSNPYAIETIELLTGVQPHWFHPRLRFFAGREHRLPVDQNTLMALVAPRGQMIYSGYAETAANVVGFEQAYRSALTVYQLHGKPENLWLNLREGDHSTRKEDIEVFIDFMDSVFGRHPLPKAETWILGYDFDAWRKQTGATLNVASYPEHKPGEALASSAAAWPARQAGIRRRIEDMLGRPAPAAPFIGMRSLSERMRAEEGWMAKEFGRPGAVSAWDRQLAQAGVKTSIIPYGDGLAGVLFHPAQGTKWPVVIWMHPYSYANGWSARQPWNPSSAYYVLEQRPDFLELVKRGVAVFAFDQIGFGSRLREATRFYQRYPQWSLMGRMVADTRGAVEALASLKEIDADRISLLGYSLGGKVALLTAALEPRVHSAAIIAGLDPLRLSHPGDGTEGLRHYSHIHGLIPRFGFFLGSETRLPFDFEEVLALAAPRRILVVAPELDRYAPVDKVRAHVESARAVYRLLGAESALTLETPLDFNRFSPRTQTRVFDWLAKE